MTESTHRLHRFFMNLRLSHKLLLGYIFVILIPTVTLEYALYNKSYHSVRDQYLQNEQDALEAAQKNLQIQLNRIHEASEALSSNSVLNSYLNGMYNTQAEELYYYIKDIQPLLNYLQGTDPAIRKITFYGSADYSLNWGNRLVTARTPPIPEPLLKDIKSLLYGVWYKSPSNDEQISYYRCLYNSNYSSPVTTLQIDVSLSQLMESFSSLAGSVFVRDPTENAFFLFQEGSLKRIPEDTLEGLPKSDLCQTRMEEPELLFIKPVDAENALDDDGNALLLMLFLLFLVLSASYYGITTSITRRITTLQKHISSSKANSLIPMPDSGYRDEVGKLTVSYNHMVDRINELLYQIYHTELEKKEAEFYALQAQIEPHFLYNILENIHMSAEQTGDRQTADMIISLGKFMRYNLNNNLSCVSLSDELSHARNYLDIHKIRMQEKLEPSFAVYTEIDDILCPRFILQPLLENAIKHAETGCRPLRIELSVRDGLEEDCNTVLLTIRDNGKGIPPTRLSSLKKSLQSTTYQGDSHIGLNSINNRLHAFYRTSQVLQIDSREGEGTQITLTLRRGGNGCEKSDRRR